MYTHEYIIECICKRKRIYPRIYIYYIYPRIYSRKKVRMTSLEYRHFFIEIFAFFNFFLYLCNVNRNFSLKGTIYMKNQSI